MSFIRTALRFLGSTGFAVVLLLLLFALTLFGTLEQVNSGLYRVQQEYFGSLFVVHQLGGMLPIPLPGGYLLLLLAFINILLGGVMRARKGWRMTGVLIAHVGVLLLLAGGFVSFRFGIRGNLTLFEGQLSNEFVSATQWEVAVTAPSDGATAAQYVIPWDDFAGLRNGGTYTFHHEALPFELRLSGFMPNANREGPPGSGTVVPLSSAREAGQNIPALAAAAAVPGGSTQEVTLWGMDGAPQWVAIDGKEWAIELKRRTWQLPFTVALDKFTRELHPGTSIPSRFSSEVTKIEGDARQPVTISMNQPLRQKGYTLYQASWGPANAGPGDALYSTFAVTRNPAEQVPSYASYVVAFGLLVHFALKLAAHLRVQHRSAS